MLTKDDKRWSSSGAGPLGTAIGTALAQQKSDPGRDYAAAGTLTCAADINEAHCKHAVPSRVCPRSMVHRRSTPIGPRSVKLKSKSQGDATVPQGLHGSRQNMSATTSAAEGGAGRAVCRPRRARAAQAGAFLKGIKVCFPPNALHSFDIA